MQADSPLVTRVDRMLLAVTDRAAAAQTFVRALDARVVGERDSPRLAARATVIGLGESELELYEPVGEGPVGEHLTRSGEGPIAVGLAAPDAEALVAHLAGQGVSFEREGQRIVIGPPVTPGLPIVVDPLVARPPAPGLVGRLYEATNTLDSDWRDAAATYARLFRLDPAAFCPIANERFGYQGTLTLFDPDRLDRIELSQTFADRQTAMRRFVERHGDSLYMCFVETGSFDALKARLLDAGARLTARGGDLDAERDTLWVHPRDLHGLLLGVSRTDFAWIWSGRPDRVPPAP